MSIVLYVLVFSFSIYWLIRLEQKEFTLENISFKNYHLYMFFLLISLVPIVLSGERYNVGTDFQTYLSIYEDIKSKGLWELVRLSKFLEPLYVVLNKISSIIFLGSEKGIFYATSFLIFSLLYFGVLGFRQRMKFSISLSYLIFFCMLFPLTLNIQRQMIAVMITFVAYKYLLESKPFKFLGILLIAAGFHSTALVILPVLLFSLFNRKINKLLYFLIIISPLIINLGVPLIQKIDYFGKYFERYNLFEYQGVSFSRIGELLLFVLPIMVNRKLLVEKYPDIPKIYPVLFLSIPIITIGGFEPWANRLIYYITILQIILHPIILSVQTSLRNKKIWCGIFIIYYISYFLLKFVIVGNEGILPYRIN